MRPRPGFWASIVVLNILLAGSVGLLAPSQVGTTGDRVGYQYVGQHPLAPDCPYNIFCYRVLIPSLLEHVPLAPTARWRLFAVTANAATGVVIARATGRGAAALLASILFQTSFAATFAVFDPFTPDAAVFLAGALLTLAWLRDRPLHGLLVALIGVFAKETVALILSAAAAAACVSRPKSRRYSWLFTAGVTWLVVLAFHVGMDRFAGWSEAGSGSADLTGGSWLARWLADGTLTLAARLFLVFIPFAFAWLFALLGVVGAPERLRMLALGAIVVLPLVYVQTVERALGTVFFVVVPLAALFLARAPLAWGVAAAVTNGLLTLRAGLSTVWLPPSPYLLLLAAIVGAATTIRILGDSRSGWVAPSGSSRAISSR